MRVPGATKHALGSETLANMPDSRPRLSHVFTQESPLRINEKQRSVGPGAAGTGRPLSTDAWPTPPTPWARPRHPGLGPLLAIAVCMLTAAKRQLGTPAKVGPRMLGEAAPPPA